MAIRSAFRPLTVDAAPEADGADGIQQMGACTLSRDAFRRWCRAESCDTGCVRARSTVQRRWTVSDLLVATAEYSVWRKQVELEVLRRSMSNSRDPDGDIPGLDEVFDGEAVDFVTHAVPSKRLIANSLRERSSLLRISAASVVPVETHRHPWSREPARQESSKRPSNLIACLNHGAVHIYRQLVDTNTPFPLSRSPVNCFSQFTIVGPQHRVITDILQVL